MHCVCHQQREIYTEIHNSEKVRTPNTRFEKKPEREKVRLFFKKAIIFQLISRYHGKLKNSGIF